MKIIRPVNLTDQGGSFSRGSTATYFNSAGVLTTAAIDEPRVNYVYSTNTQAYVCAGILLESATTNLVTNSASIASGDTRNITLVSGATYTLSFYGAGSVTLSGAHVFNIPGGVPQVQKTRTFTASSTSLTVTVSVNTVTNVQLEAGSSATSWISTSRSADICTGLGVIHSNILENEHPTWVSGASYVLGDRVILPTMHEIYECIVPNTSSTTSPHLLPTLWLKVSATNKYAAFDEQPSVVSSNANSITFILKPGRVNSVALLELAASEAIINVYAGGSQVYFARQDLITNNNVGNWYEYFYEPFYYQTQLAITELVNSSLIDLPQYGDTILCVTILRQSSTAIVGSVICGIEYTLGSTQNGVNLGIIDYSIKEVDNFGNTVLTRRKYRKRVRAQIFLFSTRVDAVSNLLTQYRATPLVWIGAKQAYTSLVLYGFYKDWDITIENSVGSSLSLEIEGLV